MELFRRISGSSTSSTDDTSFKRSRSLTTLRRKSSKDSAKVRRTIKETLKEYNASQQFVTPPYTSAPYTPLPRNPSYSSPPEVIDENPEMPPVNYTLTERRPPTPRLNSNGGESDGSAEENEVPLGVGFTALSPRRESHVAIPFTLPRLTKNRRISEHVDPMSMASIPRFMSMRKDSSIIFAEYGLSESPDEYKPYTSVPPQPIPMSNSYRMESQEKLERIVPQVSVLPEASSIPDFSSVGSSFSARQQENRTSIVSFVTSNSSAPSPTGPPAIIGSLMNNSRKILPYIPDDESYSYDLLPPSQDAAALNSRLRASRVEDMTTKLFSKDHLRTITADPKLLSLFTEFIEKNRPPASMDLLTYYLDAQKAIKAINYANALAGALGPSPVPDRSWIDLENESASPVNKMLERKASDAFKVLAEQELPRYVASVFTDIVSQNISNKITGSGVQEMHETAGELAEVFCLTDPQQPDNPIAFASEEFHRVTQYGPSYITARNCRFLQGPKTSRHSTFRIREAVRQGHEITECFLNYKRDGTPFLNLLMVAPLCDSKGQVRYFIGAQLDVTNLMTNMVGLDGFRKIMERERQNRKQSLMIDSSAELDLDLDLVRPKNVEFREMAELFSAEELEVAKDDGGKLHKDHKYVDELADEDISESADRQLSDCTTIQPLLPPGRGNGSIKSGSDYRCPSMETVEEEADTPPSKQKKPVKNAVNFLNSSLKGVYKHYILVRPYPSLRILFASPSMRTPGILQSPLMSKIGGSDKVRDELEKSLSNGRGVTVKVRWLSKLDEQNPKYAGRERWLHCTPLFSSNGAVGVYMIVIVDDDTSCDYSLSEFDAVAPMNGRPASGLSSQTGNSGNNRMSIDGRRRDAPVIKDPEEWRHEYGHDDDLVFDGPENLEL